MHSTRTNASMLCINITPKFVRIRRGVALSTHSSSLRNCQILSSNAERGTKTQRLLLSGNQKLVIDSSTSDDASMGSHFSRHFSSPFARVSDTRRHALLVTSASSNNNNNNKITSAKSGLNSTSGGESRLRAINNPSQQREQQGLADALAAGKSAKSPPGSSRGQEEKEMIDQTYELNGNNFAEQTIATPSDGPIDVLHASSKQTKSWQAVRRAVTTGPVQSNALIGGTPLIDVTSVLSLNPSKVKIYAKCEYMNPSGSIKDRIASYILQAAIDAGDLKEGMTVVAATSGNTGSAIAAACAIRGFDYIVITNKKCSIEKIDSMRAYGGTVIVAKSGVAADDPEHYQNIENTMVAENPGKYFGVNQYDNLNNALAYEATLGPEIIAQTKGLITHFVAGSSTGGTLTGTSRYLKAVNPEIKSVLADPRGSVLWDNFVNDVPENELIVGKWEIEGVGKDSIPGVLSWDVVDGAQRGDDASSFYTCRKVARDLGVLVGGSAGLNLHACAVLSGKIDNGVIVTVLPDSGVKYLSKIFNDDWMNEKGFTGKEKSPEDGEIYWRPGANDPCENQKSSRMFPINACSLQHDTRKQCNDDELNPREQTEAELRFLEETAARMVEYHRQSVKIGEEPVVLMNTPESIRAMFSEAGVGMTFEHQEPAWSEQQLRDAVTTILQTSVRSSSPLFLNQLYAGVDPVALAGEWVSAALNSNVHTFEVAPSLTEIEKSCLEKVARCWLKTNDGVETPEHDGLFVPGGSLSILYSILLARDVADSSIRKAGMDRNNKLVAFCSENAHYSYKKSAIVTGLGEENLVAVKCLPNGAMDPGALRAAIASAIAAGKTPFYVGTTAGTTVLGAFDPFSEIFDVVDEFQNANGKSQRIWTHIDGAWGGGAMLSKEHNHLMDGAERSDSFSWNPHKMLGMPLQCSVFVCKHAGSLSKANGAKAEYLFQPDKNNSGADLGDRTIQCGRKADAVKLWLAWKLRGDEGFAKCIDRSFHLAKFVQLEVENSDGKFVLVQPAQCSNVGFWYVPPRLRPFNRTTATEEDWAELGYVAPKLKNAMQKAGDAMIGFQPIASMGYVNFFRLVLPNPRHITEMDLRAMLDRMDTYGQEF